MWKIYSFRTTWAIMLNPEETLGIIGVIILALPTLRRVVKIKWGSVCVNAHYKPWHPIKYRHGDGAIMRGVWHWVQTVKALSPRWADDPQSLFSGCKQRSCMQSRVFKTTTLRSISLNVDKCFINSCIISMYLPQKVYIIFYSLL